MPAIIPLVLGAVALGLLLPACKDTEDKKIIEKEPLPPPHDGVLKIPFLNTSKNTYWADLDLDGREDPHEVIFDRQGNEKEKLAQALIDKNSWAFSACYLWRPEFPNYNRQEIYSHPLKNRLSDQLNRDLSKLKAMENPPEIYRQLIQDLEIIREDLPFVIFRNPTAEELSQFSTNAGYLGLYNLETNEIVAPETMPVSLLIHEMDHRVTASRRTESWSQDYLEKCESGEMRSVPKDPHRPSPDKARLGFEFSLDFFGRGENRLRYNDLDTWEPLYRSVELGVRACFSDKAKASALANEVRAYQTMARYLLFRVGFTQEDLENIRGEDAKRQTKAEKKLGDGLIQELTGTSLNPLWTHEMMMHYLGRGGISGKANLSTFVKDYYSRVIKDPGFVDPPDCK